MKIVALIIITSIYSASSYSDTDLFRVSLESQVESSETFHRKVAGVVLELTKSGDIVQKPIGGYVGQCRPSSDKPLKCSTSLLLEIPQNNHGLVHKTFVDHGFNVDGFHGTDIGAYYGPAAVYIKHDGGRGYCEKKYSLRGVSNWRSAYQEYRRKLQTVVKLPLNLRVLWVESFFNCGSVSEISKVEVVMDLANSEDCALSFETLRSCFIARGFEKFVLFLKE